MGNRAKHGKLDPESGKILENLSRSQPRRIHFTKAAVEALEIPDGKAASHRDIYRDDKVPFLAVSVAPTGRKTFLLCRWIRGRSEKMKLGTFPEITVEQARAKAADANGCIARGENPAEQRREIRSEMTLGELLESWLLLYAKQNKKTWAQDQWLFDKYLHQWRLRKISSITKVEVVKLHQHLGATKGRTMANRVVELLSAMFNRAVRDWGWQGTNPAEHTSAPAHVAYRAYLNGGVRIACFRS